MAIKALPLIFPEKVERHENCRPPKEAYFFFPSEEDKIIYDPKDPKLTRRKIFDIKEDYSEFEKYKLDLLKEEIQNLINQDEKVLKELDEWKDGDLLRFHQSTSFNIMNTLKLIREHLAWKKSKIFPLNLNENVLKILNTGFIYVHGRDHHFRPIIVANAQKFLKIKNNFEFEDLVTAIIYFIDYIINYMLIPGQIECWNIITDLYNVSILSIPDTLMKIFKILQSNYRARLNVIYIVGMSPWLNALWTIVKNFIDSNTNKKIKFIKENAKYEMFDLINCEQVEKKYGGLAKNLEENSDDFFPPIILSHNFLKPTDAKEELLISEDMYIEAFHQGKLALVSPYISETIKKRGSLMSCSRFDDSYYEDARSYIDKRISPLVPRARHSMDLRYSKSNSLINYLYNVNDLQNGFPFLPEKSFYSNAHKTKTFNKRTMRNARMSYDSSSIYENCKDHISQNLSLSHRQSPNSEINGNTSKIEIEIEPLELKDSTGVVKDLISSATTKKVSENSDFQNGTTRDTKDSKIEKTRSPHPVNYFSNLEVNNNSNYNTNLFEDNEIRNIKSSVFNNNSKDKSSNKKEKSNGNFKVSEFDANINENENSFNDGSKNNQRLTFNASFQFNNNHENIIYSKDSIINENREKNNIPEYIALETNAKDFCCSSKYSKCLIY